MKIFSEKINENIALYYAIYLLNLLFLTFVIASIGFILGIEISMFYFPFSAALSNVILFYSLKKIAKTSAVLGYLLGINLLLITIFFICVNIFDTSYDGLWYHQPAIIKLADGWNPVYHPFYASTLYEKGNFLWIQHYPKASWITASCIYKLTGMIESGKIINFVAALCVFFYSYYVLAKIFKGRLFYIIIFSILISLNPVATAQLFSDYVDGILSEMLTLILLSLLSMELHDGQNRKWHWLILCSSLVIITNLKFTGLFMAGIIIAIFSVFWWFKKEPIREILRKYIIIAVVSILSFFIFGFNPYYSNLQYKGHVFYPLNLKTSYVLIEESEPVILRNRNNVSKFFISILSEPVNNIQTKKISWKNPLKVSRNDLRAFAGTDVRIGGLGPLFLLALILSIIAFLFAVKEMTKNVRVLLGILIIAIFLSVIVVPTAWWARYTPQFFLIPVLLVVFPCYRATSQTNIFKRYFPIGVLLVFFMNMALIAIPNIGGNIIKTRLINNEMAVLKSRKPPLLINFSKTEFQALRTRLKEAGILYLDSDTLKTNTRELRSIYNLYGYGPVYKIND